MNAPLPLHATSCHALADAPFGLTRIFEPDIQLAQWARPRNPLIADWLDENRLALGTGFRQTLARGEAPDLRALPPGPGRDALADDLALLADMLGDLLDAQTIGVRLEVVQRAMCPRFHVDRVGIRMLCTYRGPGTEWIEEHAVDRRFLGGGANGLPDESSGLLRPGHRIHAIDPFDVALLKGSLWQSNQYRGIVHRSPAVADAPRVLVALDAGW